jgi:tRNA1Val (adenine37-N6)-methyltransferase
MEEKLKENERIDDLEYKGLKIIQNKNGFCFGIDSILLSDFAKEIPNNAKVIDLGTGTGIISILLCEKTKLSKIIGVEIQEEVYDLAKRNSKLNKLENKFEVINENVKNLEKILEKNSFDAIVTNPPYKKENTGLTNENKLKLISRHEIEADLNDFINISSKLLKNNGAFYMVHRPERLADIIDLLRKNKLEPKILQIIYPKISKEPTMILIKAVKNAKPFLKIKEPLIIYNEDNTYTEEILKIYNKK